ARLQRGGDDHDAVRYGGPQRSRPFSPGGRRDRSRAESGSTRRVREASAARPADRSQKLCPQIRPGYAGDSGLALGGKAAGEALIGPRAPIAIGDRSAIGSTDAVEKYGTPYRYRGCCEQGTASGP